MLPKIFYRGRFRKLCATYGTRIAVWPDYEQPHAYAYMQRCPQKAQADMAAARKTDVWLETIAPSVVSEDSQWRAFGALSNSRAVFESEARMMAVGEAEAEVQIADAETIVFEARDAGDKGTAAGKLSLASLEIREERARMIAKGRKTFGKGLLKFQ
jgi:hypothetical protein